MNFGLSHQKQKNLLMPIMWKVPVTGNINCIITLFLQ